MTPVRGRRSAAIRIAGRCRNRLRDLDLRRRRRADGRRAATRSATSTSSSTPGERQLDEIGMVDDERQVAVGRGEGVGASRLWPHHRHGPHHGSGCNISGMPGGDQRSTFVGRLDDQVPAGAPSVRRFDPVLDTQASQTALGHLQHRKPRVCGAGQGILRRGEPAPTPGVTPAELVPGGTDLDHPRPGRQRAVRSFGPERSIAIQTLPTGRPHLRARTWLTIAAHAADAVVRAVDPGQIHTVLEHASTSVGSDTASGVSP